MDAKEVLAYAKKNNVEIVDLRFTDWPGQWQHCSYPISEIDEGVFEDGLGFDGSSIRGWQAINESDMLMIPDPETAFIDPFFDHPTLVMICNIEDPITRQPYSRDPRWIARKAEAYLKSTGFGDTAYFGPRRSSSSSPTRASARARTTGSTASTRPKARGTPDATRGGRNLAYKPRHKEGYFPVPPIDSQQNIRSEMVLTMQKIGIQIEAHHHEVATAGQAEIDMRFTTLVAMADQLLKYKYVVKNVARKNGATATFMPKPLFGDNGSGMHCHQSIWKGGKPLFAGDGYAGLSRSASTTSAACSSTRARSRRSRTRRRTRTSGSCPATRRR
jgi:glutamine synthetase